MSGKKGSLGLVEWNLGDMVDVLQIRMNSANELYGHLLYTADQASVQCLQASNVKHINGSSVILADCEYNYNSIATSGQYFE